MFGILLDRNDLGFRRRVLGHQYCGVPVEGSNLQNSFRPCLVHDLRKDLPLTGPMDGMNERFPIASISRRTVSAGSKDFFIATWFSFQFSHLYLTRVPSRVHTLLSL